MPSTRPEAPGRPESRTGISAGRTSISTRDSGAVVGVLDWDDAAPGDPALDLAALRAHAEPWLTAALLEEDPSLAALHARADAYLAAFPLQEALWGLDSGDDQAVARGLAPYRSTSPSSDG